MPHQVLPSWSVALLPTDIDLNFGGANIDLDSMAKKTIEVIDLDTNSRRCRKDFGDQITADFLAKTPKAVIGHSTLKNKDIEIGLEGEMTFPNEKPGTQSMTVDIAGYDKIVKNLQNAAKTDPQAAQYFPMVLAVKGFAKTLPDDRLEWGDQRQARWFGPRQRCHAEGGRSGHGMTAPDQDGSSGERRATAAGQGRS